MVFVCVRAKQNMMQTTYRQTCLQRSTMGNYKSGLFWQVAIVQKYLYKVDAFEYVTVSA